MSSILLSKTDIGLKLFFAHNVRYGNSVTFRIWVALEYLQYLDNHEPQHFDFRIECTPTDRTCPLYHHQVKIMIIYEGTNNLVSGAFLKCFSIESVNDKMTDRPKTVYPTKTSGIKISDSEPQQNPS